MRLVPALSWKLGGEAGEAVDIRLVPLLEAIAATTSLSAAVVQCRMSYRAAWGLLRDYRRKLGVPLVQLERGRGAHSRSRRQGYRRSRASTRENCG
jgi:molybdenum-dependent DNA-binding transcriptional regulator ModE